MYGYRQCQPRIYLSIYLSIIIIKIIMNLLFQTIVHMAIKIYKTHIIEKLKIIRNIMLMPICCCGNSVTVLPM